MAPLPILFQDECLVAIDKPAGMLVHPGSGQEGPEWIAMKCLRDQLGQPVYPIHRLDRPTSGVLLFALDKKTAGIAQQAFETRSVTKIYHAGVCGITPGQWTCETSLQSHPDEPFLPAQTAFEQLSVTTVSPAFAKSELHLTLLQAHPFTGRFHQIRRHLLEAGFPIVGDFRYAGMERCFQLGEILGIGTRMLLQSKSLALKHPYTGQPIEIVAPVDPDFLKCFPECGRTESMGSERDTNAC